VSYVSCSLLCFLFHEIKYLISVGYKSNLLQYLERITWLMYVKNQVGEVDLDLLQ